MQLVKKTLEAGFAEDACSGQTLELGQGDQLSFGMPNPRRVMATLAQAGLPQYLDVLRASVKRERQALPCLGQFHCAGAHQDGQVRVGDALTI
jgi:hypothetical protein